MSRIEKALEKASQLRQKSPIQPVSNPVKKTVIETAVQAVPTSEPIINSFPTHPATLSISNPLLVVSTDPLSHIAEEYQKLKGVIISLSRKDELSNVLMITSALPGEGKSITSINLALCLAKEIDSTVLLIDADLRKPSITDYLGISAKLGLTDILEGRAEIEDTLLHTGVGRLVVLPAGRVASNPVELFSSNRMVQFIQEIKHRYPDRFIIFDSPPILPFAETRTLAHLVDGVILVVKERLASAPIVAEAISSLEDTRILGAVYNQVEVSIVDERYGHYYGGYRYNKPSPGVVKQTDSEIH